METSKIVLFRRTESIKKNIIYKICENAIIYVTKHDISNVLNSFFVNIGKHISESMIAGPYHHYQYLKGNYVSSLFFAPVSSADVEEIILSFKNKPGNTQSEIYHRGNVDNDWNSSVVRRSPSKAIIGFPIISDYFQCRM